MAFTQQQTNMDDSSLLTPAHFTPDERLDRVIQNVPPEIWEIIYTYKEQAGQAETRVRFHKTLQLIAACGYGHGYRSIFDYTAYGWGEEQMCTPCPDDSFVYTDYEEYHPDSD
jgi:hypothetical protein